MRTIHAFEQGSLSLADPPGENQLSPAEADELIQLWKALDAPGAKPTRTKTAIKFGPTCGVVMFSGIQMEILPKIYATQDQVPAKHVLVHMLRSAKTKLTILPQGMPSLATSHYLLDEIVHHFCDLLSKALAHGMIRRYQERAETGPYIRGKLLIKAQMREPRPDRAHYLRRELTHNNPYNHILKAVVLKLNKLVKARNLQIKLSEIIRHFTDVDTTPVTPHGLDKLTFDRTLVHWETVFQYARWFLNDNGPAPVSGSGKACCLLFLMQDLFENFLETAMARIAPQVDLKLQRITKKHLVHHQKKDILPMDPDLVLGDGQNIHCILDAKWKLLTEPSSDKTVLRPKREDLYQIYAYSRNYECQNIVLLYPAQPNLTGLVNTLEFNENKAQLRLVAINFETLAEDPELFYQQLSNLMTPLIKHTN